ncbi:porin [Lewinella sp. W8]|uniref:porin n=1 Tax=Lewinella sp. W8 TaxID=2528208 RepID=UPI0010688560|nr:porin [Lewinella sp. W8]MTB50074.1 porin [Lewinella sp. W8]
MSIIHQRTALACGLLLAVLCLSAPLGAQKNSEDTDHTYRPLKLKLDEKGDKYVRFILWHQMWATTNNLAGGSNKVQLTPSIRRSRILAYAQISPRFLLLTHFGLNGLTPGNLTTLGNNGDAPQFFLHGAWTEFKVSQDNSLYVGAGLHYWNGLTRLSSASTLNFMTLDQPRPFAPWHSLGYGDQFARHLGVYAKGQLGKLDYRVSVNSPSRASLNNGVSYAALSNITYNGVMHADADNLPTGNGIYQGYVRYNLWDAEGTKLPYNVGTYLGKKKVFALGGGFYLHPNGAYDHTEGQEGHVDVGHFAVDAFMDLPTKGGCFNAYASLMNFDYGENFVGRWAGTGTAVYGQVGYFLQAAKIMPYFAYQVGNYDGFEENMTSFNAGINYFLNGHNAKLTLEFHRINNDLTTTRGDVSQLRMQAHVFL